MRSFVIISAALGLSLGACSTPKQIALTKEPLFDKYGSPSSCEAGYNLMKEGEYANLCVPEDQGCREGYVMEPETGICRPRYYDRGNDNDTPNPEDTTVPGTDPSPTPDQTIEVYQIISQ